MFINKHFKNFIKITRFKSNLYRRLMGVEHSVKMAEDKVILGFIEQFSFTEKDKEIANKLSLKDNEDGKFKTFIFEKSKDKFNYLMQGETESCSLLITIENKDIKHWSFFEKSLKNTPFYYLLFKMNFHLHDNTSDNNFIIYGLSIGDFSKYFKISVDAKGMQNESKIISKKSRELSLKNLKIATKTIEKFKIETIAF